MVLRTVGLASPIVSSVLYCIKNILRSSTVTQVVRSIVVRIAVWIMTDLLTVRTWTMKSLGDEPMYKIIPVSMFRLIILKTNEAVTVLVE